MIKKKLTFLLAILIVTSAVVLFNCGFYIKVAAAFSISSRKNNTNGDILLKRLIIRAYLEKVPLKFKKYFHFAKFNFNLPYKNFNFKNLRINIADTRYSGYHTALIKIINIKNGEMQGLDAATFKTSIYAPVAVASETIGKFQIIKSGEIKISYKNVPSLNDGYFLNVKKAAGREAKFFIAAGSALNNANTERRRIINFGDKINIIYDENGLILKTKGMALQSGALNSKIRVKNLESGEIVECMIKSPKTAEVR